MNVYSQLDRVNIYFKLNIFDNWNYLKSIIEFLYSE